LGFRTTLAFIGVHSGPFVVQQNLPGVQASALAQRGGGGLGFILRVAVATPRLLPIGWRVILIEWLATAIGSRVIFIE
jgi:hypothetical protein